MPIGRSDGTVWESDYHRIADLPSVMPWDKPNPTEYNDGPTVDQRIEDAMSGKPDIAILKQAESDMENSLLIPRNPDAGIEPNQFKNIMMDQRELKALGRPQGGVEPDLPGGGVPRISATAPEKITVPAMKYKGEVYTGANHGEAYISYYDKFKKVPDLEKADMGFMTTKGRFVSREEALSIAKKQDQYDPTDVKHSTGHWEGQLTTETLKNTK